MRRFVILALFVSLALAGAGAARADATASPAPAAAATPTPDPAVVERAKSWFHMLQVGKIDRSQLSPAAGTVTDAQIAQVAAKIGPLGDPVTFEQEQTKVSQGSNVYVYLVTFGNSAKLEYVFGVDATTGKVTGVGVIPAQSAP
jgi:hypothetical protein